MLISDIKTTYFDDLGSILSGGRLRFYAYNSLAEVIVYVDPECTSPLGSVVSLTAAGWTSTEIYAKQSVTVFVDKFIGINEFGEESYTNIKSFNQIITTSSSSTSSNYVDTIADLRAISPIHGQAISVKSYYTLNDCPVRTYIYDENSTALDNLGTVIESGTTPIGRWLLLIDGPFVDSRIFGFIPGITSTNAAFSQFIEYCNIYKKSAYLSKGTYYLTSGGSQIINCNLKTESGTYINSEAGEYTITINSNIDIKNTFASRGIKLIINNYQTFDQTVWYENNGLINSSNISLNISQDIDFTGCTSSFGDFNLLADVTITFTEAMNLGHITGSFAITFGSLAYPSAKSVYTHIYNQSRALARISETIYVDVDATIGAYNYPAKIIGKGGKLKGGLGTLNQIEGNDFLDFSQNVTVAEYNKFQYFDGDAMVFAFNGSTFPVLDMNGKSSTKEITRSGTIIHGNVNIAANGCEIRNCTLSTYSGNAIAISHSVVTATITNSQIEADYTYFTGLITGQGTSGKYNFCEIDQIITSSNNSFLNCKINNYQLRPIYLTSTLENVSIINGTVNSLNFDATYGFGFNSLTNIYIDSSIIELIKTEAIGATWHNYGSIVIKNRLKNGKNANFMGKVAMVKVSSSSNGTLYNIVNLHPFILGLNNSINPEYASVSLKTNSGKPCTVQISSTINSVGTLQCLVYPINEKLTEAYLNYAIYSGN